MDREVSEKEEKEKGFFVRLPEELLRKLEAFSQTNARSKTEIVREALEQYLSSAATDKAPSLKQIIVKYPGRCSKCGREIQVGEVAYWSQGVLLCVECYFSQSGHVGDVKKALKAYAAYRRYKALADAAKRELDALIEKANVYEVMEQEHNILGRLNKVLDALYEYLMRVESNVQLEEIRRALVEINGKLEELVASRAVAMRKPAQKIRAREEE